MKFLKKLNEKSKKQLTDFLAEMIDKKAEKSKNGTEIV
jgi:hypothetical protein